MTDKFVRADTDRDPGLEKIIKLSQSKNSVRHRKVSRVGSKSVPWQLSTYVIGDCRELLRKLPDACIQCVVTSPPYWGLRDYGTGPDQLGLESHPDDYVSSLVEVFRQVRRVLRGDGTVWLNIGDSYIAHINGNKDSFRNPWLGHNEAPRPGTNAGAVPRTPNRQPVPGLKNKDLALVPCRLALALQADGWWVRSDIIWSKPSPVPESVRDRPTNAHEHIFLLSKSRRYFYDQDAIREPHADQRPNKQGKNAMRGQTVLRPRGCEETPDRYYPPNGRNKRNVWEVASQPCRGPHYATFPTKLIAPCILAGTAPWACGVCGKPWRRNVEVFYENPCNRASNGPRSVERRHESPGFEKRLIRHTGTTGWRSGCKHDDKTGRCVVLDPFLGSGTTALVAEQYGRLWLGFENDPKCEALIKKRLAYTQRELAGLL